MRANRCNAILEAATSRPFAFGAEFEWEHGRP